MPLRNKHNRNIFIIFAGCFVFVLFSFTISAFAVNDSKLIGKWQLVVGPATDNPVEIRLLKGGVGIVDNVEITWKTDNDKFSLFLHMKAVKWVYKISGTTLTLIGDKGDKLIYMHPSAAVKERARLEEAAKRDKDFLILCASGTAQQVQSAINCGANIKMFLKEFDFQDWNNQTHSSAGWTPLIAAAVFNSNTEVMTVLVNNGANVNTRDLDGSTVLMRAVQSSNNPEIITTLIKNRAEINTKDMNGQTALMWAVQYSKNPEVITTLIKNGAEVNAKDIRGWTTLRFTNNPDIKCILIENGAVK